MGILDKFLAEQENKAVELMSFDAYLNLCKKNKLAYASAAERMLEAIGQPEVVDTSKDPRLSRIFLNRTIRVYPAFKDFFGIEDSIERIVGFFRHSAQGLEERKQILYLLGPVGSSKSSIAERLKELIEKNPIYVLCDPNGEMSPVFESPLSVFDPKKYGADLEKEYKIPARYLTGLLSPWAVKRLKENGGDISRFKVAKVYPSKLEQIAVCKVEPGDENNQDISSLVGKTDIRQLEFFSQNDPDSYSFSGGLCRGNQGIMEFVEMFKSPLKVLHPLLTATQEGNYVGTEAISAIPFNGIVLAHSNESEWQSFKNNKTNEAFIDRVCIIKVPYCLRTDEEVKIYQKMLDSSGIDNRSCAPQTLEMLSQFSVLTRLEEPENSNLWSKMRVYNGEAIKSEDPRAKSLQEYKDSATQDEGMSGISTRFAFKILSKTFNFDVDEVSADPVHLMYVLEDSIKREQFDEERETRYIEFIKEHLVKKYVEFIGNEIQKAYLESYSDYGQNLFVKYIDLADSWVQDIDYKDPDTGILMNRGAINAELEKIEKPAGVANPKDFRGEVVNFVLRKRAAEGGQMPDWKSYKKIADIIEARMFSSTEDLLPIISFTAKSGSDEQRKHDEFVSRMAKFGYTPRQVRRLVEWYIRVKKSS